MDGSRPALAARADKRNETAGRAPQWLRSAVLLVPPLGFLLVFYFNPLGAIFQRSLAPEGALDWAGMARVLDTPYFGRVLGFTFLQAALSTLLTLACGLPATYLLARWQFRGQSFVRALATVPFLLPTIVVAFSFSTLLGPGGWLNAAAMTIFGLAEPPIRLLDTLWIILIAHVYYNLSVVIRVVGNFWAHLDPQLEQAAQVLGASRARVFREVTLPLLAPALVAAGLLVFVFDFTSFGVVLLLGGARLATLEVEIYRQTVNLFDLPVAAVLSLVQIGVTFALMAVYTRMQARLALPLRLRPQALARREPRSVRERALVALTMGALVAFIGAPLLALGVQSFAADGGSLRYYTELFVNRRDAVTYVPPAEAVWNSLLFAALTVALALPLGVLAAQALADPRLARLDPFFMLPLATSAVTLGFGFILALGAPPLNLRASPWLTPIAHALIAFPFVVRATLPVIRSIKPHLREAARVLGAAPARIWREVDAPILAHALAVGAIFAFTVSMGEFGATALVARPEMPTMPVAIYRLLGQPGAINSGQAMALSSVLALLSLLAMMAMERARWQGTDAF